MHVFITSSELHGSVLWGSVWTPRKFSDSVDYHVALKYFAVSDPRFLPVPRAIQRHGHVSRKGISNSCLTCKYCGIYVFHHDFIIFTIIYVCPISVGDSGLVGCNMCALQLRLETLCIPKKNATLSLPSCLSKSFTMFHISCVQ